MFDKKMYQNLVKEFINDYGFDENVAQEIVSSHSFDELNLILSFLHNYGKKINEKVYYAGYKQGQFDEKMDQLNM